MSPVPQKSKGVPRPGLGLRVLALLPGLPGFEPHMPLGALCPHHHVRSYAFASPSKCFAPHSVLTLSVGDVASETGTLPRRIREQSPPRACPPSSSSMTWSTVRRPLLSDPHRLPHSEPRASPLHKGILAASALKLPPCCLFTQHRPVQVSLLPLFSVNTRKRPQPCKEAALPCCALPS